MLENNKMISEITELVNKVKSELANEINKLKSTKLKIVLCSDC